MPVNFLQLFQESWNFMRNQANFTLVGLALLIGLQVANLFILPPITPENLAGNTPESVLTLNLPSLVVPALIDVFVTILLILNIKAINQGNYRHFFQPLSAAFKALLPVVAMSMLMALPISIGVSSGVLATQMPSLGIISLPLLVSGCYIFVKFCLLAYVYLLEEPQKSLGETIKFTWQLSRGKMLTLILFCIVVYLLPSLIANQIAQLGALPARVLSAFFSLYFVIFSFRFYQIYRNLNA